MCTLNPVSDKKVKLFPSSDKKNGDAFFPRYKIPLTDGMDPDTKAYDMDAERVLTNITLVIKSSKEYFLTIPEAQAGQLRILDSYFVVNNQMSTQIQMVIGTSVLTRCDNESLYINPYRMGFYKIPIPYFADSISMTQLRVFTYQNIPITSFVVERGNKYTFTVKHDGTIEGPEVRDIITNNLVIKG